MLFLVFANIFLFQNTRSVEILENKKNMERTIAALNLELHGLESSSADWAYWTDTYDFALGKAPEYIQTNFTTDTFVNLKLNLIAVLDNKKSLLYAQTYDASQGSLTIPSDQFLGSLSNLYSNGGDPTTVARSGILIVDGRPMLIVSRSILKSDRSGPQSGLLVIGRLLDETELAVISEIVQLPVRCVILSDDGNKITDNNNSITSDEFLRFQKAREKNTTVVLTLSVDKVASYRRVEDIDGDPVLLFKTENTRQLYRLARSGIFIFILCLLISAGLNVASLVRSIKRIILDPILRMEQGLKNIRSRKGGTLLANLPDSGDDEIAGLARSVNGLLAEVNELNSGLEEKVKRRTLELEVSNRELNAFSYSVAHDLRAPLRSIEGFSQIFLDEYGPIIPEKGHEYLERVRRNTIRMGELIDDMLKLSQVSSTELSVQETDLSTLASEVARELGTDNYNRDLVVKIEPGMSATGDPCLLRVVLSNLMGNAWKFTSKHKHTNISIGTVTDPLHGPAFFVRDDGIGFDDAYKAKLFSAFQRLHSDKEFPGTGIGLAIVERIVHRHGGEVWAEGEVGKGATFYFTIPARP